MTDGLAGDQEDDDDQDGDDGGGDQVDDDDQADCEVVFGKTKKGDYRLRNYHWTKNETHALFYSLLQHESVLKSKGPDPDKLRDKAWQDVIGK